MRRRRLVNTKLADAQYLTLIRLAEESGKSLSEYLRDMVVDHIALEEQGGLLAIVRLLDALQMEVREMRNLLDGLNYELIRKGVA